MDKVIKPPYISYGSYRLHPDITQQYVYEAIKCGYRYIDTARLYKNEKYVGLAIRQAISEGIVERSELTVTTKLWRNDMQGKDRMRAAIIDSFQILDIGYIDRVLLHYPPKDFSQFKYLSEIQSELPNIILHIGVSNFNLLNLKKLFQETQLTPYCNQIEANLLLNRSDVIEYCRVMNIIVEVHSIFARRHPAILDNEVLKEFAQRYDTTIEKIILWYYAKMNINIVTGGTHHIGSNFKNFNDFEIMFRVDSNVNDFQVNISMQTLNTLEEVYNQLSYYKNYL